jgi:LysR family transcriptional regulator, glycine cleavage system transcriptional activator
MSSRLPPLPALRAFAALAKLGSVSAAADALSLTHGAVAHQVRALEAFLGVTLVERRGRQLGLTDAGRIYGYQVRQTLDDLADVTERLKHGRRATDERTLRIAVLPSFAHGWLVPRLAGFRRRFPRARLALHASMGFVDLEAANVDCAIRFGHGRWPGVVTQRLMGDTLVLVASPTLLGTRGTPELEALLKLPLLEASESWSSWLSSLPSPPRAPRPPARIEFTDSTHLLEAARASLGIALTRRSIADGLLQRGELVLAHSHACEHASSYFALTRPMPRADAALDGFVEWLQRECARFGASLLRARRS